MCDYSAEATLNRKAEVGDLLVNAAISNHTVGLVSPKDYEVAVCLTEGSRVTVSGLSESVRRKHGLRYGAVAATFDKDIPEGPGFRDGLIFDGSSRVVLFQDLGPDFYVRVTSIPLDEAGAETRELVEA